MFPGLILQQSLHWFKCKVFSILLERFHEVDWQQHSVESWRCFELLDIPKFRQQTSFKYFRWLGILDHMCKLFAATFFASVSRTIQSPSTHTMNFVATTPHHPLNPNTERTRA